MSSPEQPQPTGADFIRFLEEKRYLELRENIERIRASKSHISMVDTPDTEQDQTPTIYMPTNESVLIEPEIGTPTVKRPIN